jgi:NodT family efflux transporter outer membrane factor (OMF) lipoprotein
MVDAAGAIAPIVQVNGVMRGSPIALITRVLGATTISPHRFIVAGLLLATFSLTGCAGHFREWMHNGFKVGPDYMRPAAQVADEYIEVDDPRVISAEADYSQWWTVFNDPYLDNLVQTAYRQNLPLRVAAFRVLRARSRLGIARGTIFPQQQELFGDYTKELLSKNTFPGNLPGSPRSAEVVDVGFDAAWELDIWGRFRRSIESASADFDATVEDYDDVLVTLVADVAAAYVEIRTVEQQIAYQLSNVAIQQGSLEIATARAEGGLTSELDVKQAASSLANTKSFVPPLESQLRRAKNRLCVLLGMPPQRISDLLGESKATTTASVIPIAPSEIAVGIPADLLRRRPDVRAAERRVAAQSAQIGVAASDLFPSFTISGNIGYQAPNLSNLVTGASNSGFIAAPSINWPVLNYGRIRNNIAVQEAAYQQLAVNYEQTVLAANQEVEDALIAFLKAQEQYQDGLIGVKASQEAVDIALVQYRNGEIDFNRVFTLQDDLVDQQFQLAATLGNIALNMIRTYKALGGGWQIRLNPSAATGEVNYPPRPELRNDPPANGNVLPQPPAGPLPPGAAPNPPAAPVPAVEDNSGLRFRAAPQISPTGHWEFTAARHSN